MTTDLSVSPAGLPGPPILVDTHAHICDSAFDDDRAAVFGRAEQAGIRAVIAVGEDIGDARRNLDLAASFPLLKPAAGLYPTHLDTDAADDMIAFIREHRARLFAIGEVGLDFWVVREEAARELQRSIFARFITLSRDLSLPLNVHSRSAGRHAVDMLIREGAERVQMHAFDGKISTARPAVEAGYFFSVPPSIVRSRQKQKLIGHLPLDCLLVETDSPVLGPEPGQRNEPANLMMAVQAIAGIKSVPEKAVMEAVAVNTKRLYGI